jgi:aminoglycoside phosphotransferase (APT) family kinase protein
MVSLSALPLELLLPGDETLPIRVHGDLSAARELLPGRQLTSPSGAERPAAVLRLPGGPAPTGRTVETLLREVEQGRVALWISERREPKALGAARGDVGEDCLRFLAGGRTLCRPEAAWTVPIAGAGKLDFLRQLYQTTLGRRGRTDPGRYRYRVELICPAGGPRTSWILELLRDLGRRRIVALEPRSLGRIDRTATGMTVCQLETAQEERLALKVTRDAVHAQGLEREAAHLRRLQGLHGLPQEIAHALPRIVDAGRRHGFAWRLEEWLPGRSAADLMYRPRQREQVFERAVDWITALHECATAPARPAGEYASWARATVARIAERAGARDEAFARRLASYVESRLKCAALPTFPGHGDYWLGNLLRDRASGRIRGVIDWQHGDVQAPPLADLLHLLFTRKGPLSRYAHGSRVAAFLAGRLRRRDWRRIVRYLKRLHLDPATTGLLGVLYWVHYLAEWEATEADKRDWYRRSYRAVRRTLDGDFESRLDRLGTRLQASTARSSWTA